MHNEQREQCESEIENGQILATMTKTEGWKQIVQPFLAHRKETCLTMLKCEGDIDMIRRMQVAIGEIEYIEDLIAGVDVTARKAHTFLAEDAKAASEQSNPVTSTKTKE